MEQQFSRQFASEMRMIPKRCKTKAVNFRINPAKFLERAPRPHCQAEEVKRLIKLSELRK